LKINKNNTSKWLLYSKYKNGQGYLVIFKVGHNIYSLISLKIKNFYVIAQTDLFNAR
jgi:hypothetical protein